MTKKNDMKYMLLFEIEDNKNSKRCTKKLINTIINFCKYGKKKEKKQYIKKT